MNCVRWRQSTARSEVSHQLRLLVCIALYKLLLLNQTKNTDALNVCGLLSAYTNKRKAYLREEIETTKALELVTPLALTTLLGLGDEPSNVTSLGVYIARDIHCREGLEREELLEERCVTSLAGRLRSATAYHTKLTSITTQE